MPTPKISAKKPKIIATNDANMVFVNDSTESVVAKLFNIAQADIAYFGQKDLQQACLIKKMVKELNIPIKISICPIVREKSGIAMSSRNIYLSDMEKKRALCLKASLDHIVLSVRHGKKDVGALKKEGLRVLRSGTDKIDYLEILRR